MPSFSQRLLALYTLSYPYFQGILTLLIPVTVAEMFFLKVPVVITMIGFLPLYSLLIQLVITIVGAYSFTKEYQHRFSLLNLIGLIATFLPYQWLLGISSIRGVYRELLKQNNWEKTAHMGAHRRGSHGTVQKQSAIPVTRVQSR